MRHARSLAVTFLAFLIVPASARAQGGAAPVEEVKMVEVEAGSPPEVLLAFYDTGEMSIPSDRVKKYRAHLKKLAFRCKDSSATLAAVSNGAVQSLERHANKKLTNLEFLKKWRNSLGGRLNSNPDCRRAAASLVVGIGGEQIDVGVATVMQQLPRGGGGG